MNIQKESKGRRIAKIVPLVIGVFITAAISGGFLLVLNKDIEPEISGFVFRWWHFTLNYGLVGGIVPVLFYVIAYRKYLFLTNRSKEDSK